MSNKQAILSKNERARAAGFLREQARPLERAVYVYEFEEGALQAVLDELAKYQNADGGFGHALEPDIRCAASSALVTTVALQHLSRAGRTAECRLVSGAIRYLVDSYDKAQPEGWDIVPSEVDDSPRAPWWNYNPAFKGWGNPGLEIVGFLYEYAAIVSPELLDKLSQQAITHINEVSSRQDFHELLCCLRFAARAPEAVLLQVKPAIDEMVQACVTTDPSGWNAYCLTPLQVADRPDSMYYARLSSSIELNLQHMIDKQAEDGAWHPAWSWGQFEETWLVAEREWKGVLTLDALRTLQAYDALEA